MRRLVLSLLALALCAGATPAMGPSPDPSAGPLSTDGSAMTAIRGLDPRFADLDEYADVQRRASSTFDFAPIVAGSWIHVLPTLDQFVDQYGFATDQAWAGLGLGRVVEVMLVADCETPVTAPVSADPCSWRHTWLYRVLPTGEVVPLYDAGSPDVAPG